MNEKALEVHNMLKEIIPGSRTFFERKDPGYQGVWVELTTFVGTGETKHRFDFAWPEKLWEDLAVDEVVSLVNRAVELELSYEPE